MAASEEARLNELSCCVIVPTYNNSGTIGTVIEDVLRYAPFVYVVCDGPTDTTENLIKNHPGVRLISYSPNRGKGFALKTAFRKVVADGFRYAITLDSDGQHFASDIPVFLDEIARHPDSLLVGARKMQGQQQSKGSSFANKFSNFWYQVDTFHSLPDTQSGYRLYPVKKLQNFRFLSTRYEFEVEVLVKACWWGIPVRPVSVNVFYPPADERVSHFRPGKDFLRISLLNTYLLVSAVLYGHWLVIMRALKPSSIRRFLIKTFVDSSGSPAKKAAAVGFGVFMGILPIWGWQMITAASVAHFLRLNKAIVLVASNISAAPLVPFIVFLSYEAGKLILPESMHVPLRWDVLQEDPALFFAESGLQYLLGACLLAVVCGLLAFAITFPLFKSIQQDNPIEHA